MAGLPRKEDGSEWLSDVCEEVAEWMDFGDEYEEGVEDKDQDSMQHPRNNRARFLPIPPIFAPFAFQLPPSNKR